MPADILDLAKAEYAEAEDEHVHAAERMTTLDHAIYAFFIVIGVFFWLGIGTVIATQLHLNGLMGLAVMIAWPFPLLPLGLLVTGVIIPLVRIIRLKAERIEGYND